jgi:signal transduction histidine kinase/ActR/RegA family two-component response regulator
MSDTPKVPVTNYGSRTFWYGLTVIFFAISAVLAVLLQAIWIRTDAELKATQIQADSSLNLAVQFDREYLRFKHQLEIFIGNRRDLQALKNRYEILLSRIQLLEENPTTQDLQTEPDYKDLMLGMRSLATNVDHLIEGQYPDELELSHLLQEMLALAPSVQAFVHMTNRKVVLHLERQQALARKQDRLIVSLAVSLLALLTLSLAGLIKAQRKARIERVELEQLNFQLRSARQEAESASQAKSRFLANMSHELRTPFNGLLGMLQVLAQSDLNNEQRELLDTAHQSAQHLLGLLNDILDLSSLDADSLIIRSAPMNVCQTIQDVIDWMAPSANTSSGLAIDFNDSGCITHAHGVVLGDVTRVRQVVLNLLSNAIKFTPEGKIELALNCAQIDEQNIRWTLCVKDTGMGMSDDTKARLFQRFRPGDESITRKHGGAGLGLEISRALAHRMGGDILVHSELGIGSTFIFEWNTPIYVADTNSVSATTGHELVEATNARVECEHRSVACVLVVDDHPVNRSVLGVMLAKLGCEVLFADDGQKGLEMVLNHRTDLVLMDLHMPQMDGFACTRAIRALPNQLKALVPIVAVSADVLPETRKLVKSAGFSGFLAKPVLQNELNRTVQEQMMS